MQLSPYGGKIFEVMDCGFNVLLKYVPIFSSDLSTFSEATVNAGLWSSQVEEAVKFLYLFFFIQQINAVTHLHLSHQLRGVTSFFSPLEHARTHAVTLYFPFFE